MVSTLASYSVAARLRNPPLLPTALSPRPLLPSYLPNRRRPLNALSAASASSSGLPERPRTLFPGGFKRPEIKVPTLVLRLSAEEVLRGEGAASAISVAVSKGVGIVVLDAGRDESGGRVYEAARVLKSVVGDRAYLLISERVDVASAVGASGVVLSDDGIPAIVARNMLTKSKSDSVYLPLVAKTVQAPNPVLSPSSSEGADFLIISTYIDNISRLKDSMAKQVKVPIFLVLMDLVADESPDDVTSQLLESGAAGLVLSLSHMQSVTDNLLKKMCLGTNTTDRASQDVYSFPSKFDTDNIRVVSNGKMQIAGFTRLNEKEIHLIEMERVLLNEAVSVIRKAVPTVII